MRTTFIRLPQMLGSIALATFLFCPGSAKAADDHGSLTGLKEVKVAFDIKDGDGKLLLGRLDIIDETRQSLIQQGVTPHFILAFRGPATRLVQTDPDKIKPEDRAMAAEDRHADQGNERGSRRRRIRAVCRRGAGTGNKD